MTKASHAATTKALIGRLVKADKALGCFTTVLADQASSEAAAIDGLHEAGSRRGSLDGLAIGVKDIIDVAGIPTQAGSLTRRDAPKATADAPVVARLKAAGAIVAAKTMTVEYAFGGWGTNVTVGTPRNPWDRKVHRVPGGSSSGSGVAVGAGLLPAALGTDTGGSVRLPAAFCGLVGLKTSIGLISRAGVVPLALSLDTIGPMTDTVRRSAELLAVMQGEDGSDPATHGIRRGDPLADLERGISGMRIGRLADTDLPGLSDEVRSAFDSAVRTLADLGAAIVPFRMPATLEDATSRCGNIISVEAYTNNRTHVDDPASGLAPAIRARMQSGRAVSAADWLTALERWRTERERFLHALDRLDAIVLPTTAATAIAVAAVDEAQSPGVYTRFANYLELCALAVPMGLGNRTGLPTSLQIVCRRLDDPLALRIGQAYETARGAFPQPPS